MGRRVMPSSFSRSLGACLRWWGKRDSYHMVYEAGNGDLPAFLPPPTLPFTHHGPDIGCRELGLDHRGVASLVLPCLLPVLCLCA